MALSALASGALSTAACSKDKGPTCGQAAAHFMTMLDAELARDGDPERLDTARANRPALQDALLRGCEEQKWSLSTRQCMLDAKSATETKSCVPELIAPAVPESSGTAPGPQ
jgi:hypothetical protein